MYKEYIIAIDTFDESAVIITKDLIINLDYNLIKSLLLNKGLLNYNQK